MIIPVLDIKNGIAVSGKSGMRETYLPLKTIFHNSSDPLKIAGALKEAGAQRLYIADLDAIEGKGSNQELLENINKIISVTLDAGSGDIKSVKKDLDIADKVIVATETLKSFSDLDEIFKTFSKRELIISIDFKEGKILSKYLEIEFQKLKKKLEELKPDEMVLLDISGVGTEKGFKKDLIDKFRGFEDSLILGGGINLEDMDNLQKKGISKFLVGSALHSGKISHPFDL